MAMTSLPVPDSPNSITVLSTFAMTLALDKIFLMAGLSAMGALLSESSSLRYVVQSCLNGARADCGSGVDVFVDIDPQNVL